MPVTSATDWCRRPSRDQAGRRSAPRSRAAAPWYTSRPTIPAWRAGISGASHAGATRVGDCHGQEGLTRKAHRSEASAGENPARAKAKSATKAKARTLQSTKRVKRSAAGSAKRKTRAAKSGPAPAPVNSVVVVVGDTHLPNLKGVAKNLRARGMKVDSVLEGTGQITGSFAKSPSSLRNVKGVAAVEKVPKIQLPPAGSDVQ